jgi:hypothetical protein
LKEAAPPAVLQKIKREKGVIEGSSLDFSLFAGR